MERDLQDLIRDLQDLIEDPRFRAYHERTPWGKTFNPLDVLGVASFEIRHSNVLAWLLSPAETHRAGDAFLRGFVGAINEAAEHQGAEPLPAGFASDSVRVERELDYVDITIFLDRVSEDGSDDRPVVIAVENKLSPASPDDADQVEAYETALRVKHGENVRIQSVLLTTSPPRNPEDGFVHVGWSQVRELATSVRDSRRLAGDEGRRVREFLDDYVEVIERFVPPDLVTDDFGPLLDDYRPLLQRLAELKGGAGPAPEDLPAELGEFRISVCRIVNDLRQEPGRLHSVVKSFLKEKGFKTWGSGGFLHFRKPADETWGSLPLPWWPPRWTLAFAPRWVNLSLEFSLARPTRPAVERVAEFMRANPIDTSPEAGAKYPVKNRSGHLVAYRDTLVTDEDLVKTPVTDIERLVLDRLAAFLDADFARVVTYMKCLGFDPAASEDRSG